MALAVIAQAIGRRFRSLSVTKPEAGMVSPAGMRYHLEEGEGGMEKGRTRK